MNSYLKVGIPEFDISKLYIKDFNKVIDSKILSNSGPRHNFFISNLKNYLRTKRDIALYSNATLALLAALKTVYKEGDEVITTSFSFIATNSILKFLNIKAKYCDIDPLTYNIDITKLKKIITKKTKILYIVNVFGNPCELQEIEIICRKEKIILIIDNAAGFGTVYKSKSSCDYGDINITSFHATKIFSTIEGGMVICKSSYFKKINAIKEFGYNKQKIILDYGLNCKLNEIQSTIGIHNLKKNNTVIKKRKKIYKYYLENLINKKISFQKINTNFYNYSNFAMTIDNCDINKLLSHLLENKIVAKRYWNYVFDNKSTNAVIISKKIICLPLNSFMKKKHVVFISKKILEFLD